MQKVIQKIYRRLQEGPTRLASQFSTIICWLLTNEVPCETIKYFFNEKRLQEGATKVASQFECYYNSILLVGFKFASQIIGESQLLFQSHKGTNEHQVGIVGRFSQVIFMVGFEFKTSTFKPLWSRSNNHQTTTLNCKMLIDN